MFPAIIRSIRMRIAVDFDGVLAEEEYPGIGALIRDAKAAMVLLKRWGHLLIINTCRAGFPQKAAEVWLTDHGIPYDYINENDPVLLLKYEVDCRKISVDLNIDDKNFGGFPGWEEVLWGVAVGQDQMDDVRDLLIASEG